MGVHIDPKYIQDVYKNISDQELYGDTLWNGSERVVQDKKIREKGLKDFIGESGSKERKAIEQAQAKHLGDLKRQNMTYDLGKGRYVTPEEAGGAVFKTLEQKRREEEESKRLAEGAEEKEPPLYDQEEEDKKEKERKGFKSFESSRAKPEELKKGMSIGEEAAGTAAKGAGAAGEGAIAAGEAATTTAAEAAAATGGAVAASGATAAGGSAVVATAATVGPPTAIVAVVIIVIIALVMIVGPLLKLGKFGHIEANAASPFASQTFNVANKYEDLKKYLGSDIDRFKKEIESIKTNATGKNKDQVVALCDEILKAADELKTKTGDTPEDKGKKIELTTTIMEKVKVLIPLLYSCDEYNLKNKTRSVWGVYFYELPRPGENGFPDYEPYVGAERQYATAEFICFIGKSIKNYNENFIKNFPNLLVNGSIPSAYKVAIGDLSLPSGGSMGGHASHQKGNDVDVIINNGVMAFRKSITKNYNQNVARLWLQSIKQAGGDRAITFYDDPTLVKEGLCVYEGGHEDHFHVRLNYKQ